MNQEDYQPNTARDYLDAMQETHDRLSASQVGADANAYIVAKARGESDDDIPLKQMKAHRDLVHATANLEHAKSQYQETLGQTSLAFEHQKAEGSARAALWSLSASIVRQSAKRMR